MSASSTVSDYFVVPPYNLQHSTQPTCQTTMVQHAKTSTLPCASPDNEDWISLSNASQCIDQLDTFIADQSEVNMEANRAMDHAAFEAIMAEFPSVDKTEEHGAQSANDGATTTTPKMTPGHHDWVTQIETARQEEKREITSDTVPVLPKTQIASSRASSVLSQTNETQHPQAEQPHRATIDTNVQHSSINLRVAAPEANAGHGNDIRAYSKHTNCLDTPSSEAFSRQFPFEEESNSEHEVESLHKVSSKRVAAADLFVKSQHEPEQPEASALFAPNETSNIHGDFELFLAQRLKNAIADEEPIEPLPGHSDASNIDNGAVAYDAVSNHFSIDMNAGYGTDGNFIYPRLINDGRKPDLSLEELVILVIAKSPGRSLTLVQICNRICSICRYYRDQKRQNNIDNEVGGHQWATNVEDILHQYDFPTVPSAGSNDSEIYFSLPSGGEWWVLKKQGKGKGRPFKFMALDLDIRLMIYTWTLRLPLAPRWGWAMDTEYTMKAKELYDRVDRQPQRLTTKGPANWELRTRPLDEILALTMINKEVAKEALPVFYRKNCFYFATPKILGRFYAGIPGRSQWMRNIVLKFEPAKIDHQCKRSIAQLFNTRLRNLHIVVDEKKLLIDHVVATIENVPGVKFLGELGGLDRVTFQGEYQHLRKYLSSKEITTAKSKKSKDYDTDEGIEEAVKRAHQQKNKEFRRTYRENLRSIMRAENQMKKDEHRLEVSRRQQEREERKESRMHSIEEERERKRAARERDRRAKERAKEEAKEEKAERRQREKAARMRKLKAAEEEKAARREARGQAKHERARKTPSGTKKSKDDSETKRIKELKKSVKARLGQQKGKRGRGTLPSDEETDTENEHSSADSSSSDNESDSDMSLAAPSPATHRKKSVFYDGSYPNGLFNKVKKRSVPTHHAPETEDDSEAPSESTEDECPSPQPKRVKRSKGSCKGGVPSTKKGTGAAKRVKVSSAEKMAAVRRTINQGKPKVPQNGRSNHKGVASSAKKSAVSRVRADGRVSSDPDF